MLYPPNVHHFEGEGGYRHPLLLVECLRGLHYWRAMFFNILPSFVQIQEQGRTIDTNIIRLSQNYKNRRIDEHHHHSQTEYFLLPQQTGDNEGFRGASRSWSFPQVNLQGS